MKAWLITWEWIGDHAKVEQPIVSILSPRLSGENVRQYVERLYMDLTPYSFTERMEIARRKRTNPYPAEFNRVNGVRWQGQIMCGDNPSLFARLVDDLTVTRDADGNERVSWKERPFRRPDWLTNV